MLIWLMALFSLFNGLCAFAPNYEWMLVLRFLSGLPHGAYFGIGALVAVSLVPLNKRNQAVGRMFLGLTVATIIGVPLANWLGQYVGWRWRSEEHTSELQSLMRISYAVFCLQKKTNTEQ